MKRPCLHSDSKVIDTRHRRQGLRRRRECLKCGHRWTTWEIADDQLKTMRRVDRAIAFIEALAPDEVEPHSVMAASAFERE